MKLLGVFISLGVVAGGGWFGYNRWVKPSDADAFITKTLERGDIVKTVSATGTLEPLVKVIVGSQVSGNILKWHKDFNHTVKAGDVLAEIDPDRFKTVLAQAKADLAIAKAREEAAVVRARDAERERARIEELRAQRNASENEYLVVKATAEAATAEWHAAQAEVLAAEARVGAAEVDLDRTIIRAPIDGVVISRDIDVGVTVAASLQAPTLFTIANDLKKMQVNASVSEADIGLIDEGMPATFTVDAYPRRTFSGSISQIRYNANIVENVVTYTTLIAVENDDLALRPGMTANVTFEVAREEDVVRVPNAALRFDPAPVDPAEMLAGRSRVPKGPTVYQLQQGKPVAKRVTIGLTDGTYSNLLDGEVKEGDTVVTERNWNSDSRRRPDMTRSLQRGR